jgi:preprotein translocase subunit SecA
VGLGRIPKQNLLPFSIDPETVGIDPSQLERHEIEAKLGEAIDEFYRNKEGVFGRDELRYYERIIRLNIVDIQWKDHLQAIDHLKEWINQMGVRPEGPR